jgi:hypothetical protein
LKPLDDDALVPVLSPADEEFLCSALDDSSADKPCVLLDGTPIATAPRTVTPTVAGAAQEVEKLDLEKNGKAEEKKLDKKGGLKDSLSMRWEGLRHTVSTTAEKALKSKPPLENKGKEKKHVITTEEVKDDKEKEKEPDFKSEEDELTAALDQLNLSTKDVSLQSHFFDFTDSNQQ